MSGDLPLEKAPRTEEMETVLSVAAYSCCSISMIILNKLVVDTYGMDFPFELIFLQNFAALVLIWALKKKGLVFYPDFEWRVAKQWLPLTLIFLLMLWTSIKSLKLMSVAIQTIIKNCAIILTALGDAHFFQKKLSLHIFLSFLVMIMGSVVGSASDPWMTSWGLFWTLVNVAATVSYVLYMKLLVKTVSNEIGRYGPVFYNNLMSMPFVIVPALTSAEEMSSALAAAPTGAKVSLIAMLLVGSCMTFASFWCMKMTSPTTYSVMGSLNKVPLSFLGILIFHHSPTMASGFGIALNLCGGLWYTWLNRPPKPESPTDKPTRMV